MNELRRLKPQAKGEISFNLPSLSENRTENGLEYIFATNKNLPIVQLYYTLPAGSVYDKVDEYGLAYLTSLLIDEGAGEYDSLQLDNEFEKIGTSFSISIDNDFMYFSILCMEEYFDRSVELLSKVINQPHLSEKDYKREQKQLITKIIQSNDNPGYVASKVFQKKIFTGSNYSNPIIGYGNSIESLLPGNANQFYKTNIQNVTPLLVGVGSVTAKKFEDTFLEYFQNQFEKKGADTNLNNVEESFPALYLIDKPAAAQSEIRIGHISAPKNENDFFPKLIINTILGGQFNSRLNSNLRERRGYTYGVNSSFNYNKSFGEFVVSTSVQTEVTAKAVSEILNELKLIRESILNEETEYAKSYLTKRFPSMFETNSQIARNILSTRIHNFSPSFLERYIEKLNAVDKETILRTAEKSILPDMSIIVLVADKEKVIDDLRILKMEPVELDTDGNELN